MEGHVQQTGQVSQSPRGKLSQLSQGLAGSQSVENSSSRKEGREERLERHQGQIVNCLICKEAWILF